ncbi:MAG: hypothetical protein IJZ72_00820 [Oscillospiraceae bacterium]|nr:hypothetical protein [Oscillospiraceae bacterium]
MEYKMDNAGIMHMAVRGGGRSNTFRLAVTLKDKVCPVRLNEAFHKIAPRFPTIVAGIRSGFYHHYVVPSKDCPDVQPDYGTLMYITASEIKSCAMRVLYTENQIITEFFHSLTDGYGGVVFTKTLVAEYLGEELCHCGEAVISEETDDSFMKFAGKKRIGFNRQRVYLPLKSEKRYELHTVTGIFDVNALLEQAHRHNVSLTVFLAAVLSESLLEMQETHGIRKKRPVQIMVPVNLRNIFPSRTLRNFSLYALPKIESTDSARSFAEVAASIEMQMKEQLSEEYLMAMMATNATIERNMFMRYIPLKIKCAALKTGFFICGERTSCLSMSNLGQISFPESLRENVVRADFVLSPRLISAYNCGIITCGSSLYLTFSRSCAEPVLERIFFRRLAEMECVPALEMDGAAVDLTAFLKRKAKV